MFQAEVGVDALANRSEVKDRDVVQGLLASAPLREVVFLDVPAQAPDQLPAAPGQFVKRLVGHVGDPENRGIAGIRL